MFFLQLYKNPDLALFNVCLEKNPQEQERKQNPKPMKTYSKGCFVPNTRDSPSLWGPRQQAHPSWPHCCEFLIADQQKEEGHTPPKRQIKMDPRISLRER